MTSVNAPSNQEPDDSYNDILAFIKYEGELVEGGYLDIKKSADILYSVDELLKYYLTQIDPDIDEEEIEIPVRIRKGSWEIVIPDNIDALLLHGFITWSAAKYFGTALSEMAKNDFAGISLKLLFRKAFSTIINVIKIAKHVGSAALSKFENVKFSEDQKSIGIFDEEGRILWMPKEAIDMYVYSPKILLSKIVGIVEEERELVIGVFDESKKLTQETITYPNKKIFVEDSDEENDGFLFPELKHGDPVTLEGHITRGNEKANTIGFFYKGHILTCYPHAGNIKIHKNQLFSNVIMEGVVERLSIDGHLIATRPKIKYHKLTKVRKIEKPKDIFDMK